MLNAEMGANSHRKAESIGVHLWPPRHHLGLGREPPLKPRAQERASWLVSRNSAFIHTLSRLPCLPFSRHCRSPTQVPVTPRRTPSSSVLSSCAVMASRPSSWALWFSKFILCSNLCLMGSRQWLLPTSSFPTAHCECGNHILKAMPIQGYMLVMKEIEGVPSAHNQMPSYGFLTRSDWNARNPFRGATPHWHAFRKGPGTYSPLPGFHFFSVSAPPTPRNLRSISLAFAFPWPTLMTPQFLALYPLQLSFYNQVVLYKPYFPRLFQ